MKVPSSLPPVLLKETSSETWENSRRPELLALLRDEVYGAAPLRGFSTRFSLSEETKDAMHTKIDCRAYTVTVSAPLGEYRFPFYLYLPQQRKGPLPVLLLINNRERGLIDPKSSRTDGFFPVAELTARGFAAAALLTKDVDTDQDDGFQNGIVRIFESDLSHRAPNAWGTIAAWAFGASRVMDCLSQLPELDPARISAVGHSRGGKTALWCAANDRRFYSAYSSCSGCTGAAITRGKQGERVADINRAFPYWFCQNYKNWNGREEEMPFDQQMLLALIAPRPLYVGSATEDLWADPQAEFLSACLAGEAYRLYGEKGLAGEFPAPETPLHGGRIGYHLRTGEHNLTAYDWQRYIDFLQGQPDFAVK
ncbi:MAG: hypothetical protein HFG27_09725 [Provencibacterium sp.]|jgi:hypothetical protein|nr:hypothetical protein [Provencibacterium sp.]